VGSEVAYATVAGCDSQFLTILDYVVARLG
jgi:hypothetical protein